MTFDMNDAELPRGSDLIPDGSFVKVAMAIRPGGIDGQGETDRGLLKGSNAPGSDVLMLDTEFTVIAGPHARRKFWHNFTVSGGKRDDQGVSIGWKISKGQFRAMIDSALGLDPHDMSEAARGQRILRGLADLNGITFAAKVMVQPANDPRYGDSNRLDRVVLPGEPEDPACHGWRGGSFRAGVPRSPARDHPSPERFRVVDADAERRRGRKWSRATVCRRRAASRVAAPGTRQRAGHTGTRDRRPLLVERVRRAMTRWHESDGRGPAVARPPEASRRCRCRPPPLRHRSNGCSARSVAARRRGSATPTNCAGTRSRPTGSARWHAATPVARSRGGAAA